MFNRFMGQEIAERAKLIERAAEVPFREGVLTDGTRSVNCIFYDCGVVSVPVPAEPPKDCFIAMALARRLVSVLEATAKCRKLDENSLTTLRCTRSYIQRNEKIRV